MKNKEESSVVGILFSPDNKEVLLIKRRDVPVWVLPGGGVDPGETPKKAIIREMKEETGLTVAIDRLVGEYTPINRLTRHSYLFSCNLVEGIPAIGEETKDIRFFPLTDLPKNIPPPYENWIEEARQKLPFIIKRKLKEITYFQLIKAAILHPILVFRFLLSRFSLHIND